MRGIFRSPCLRELRSSSGGKCSTFVIIIMRMGYDACFKNEVSVSFIGTAAQQHIYCYVSHGILSVSRWYNLLLPGVTRDGTCSRLCDILLTTRRGLVESSRYTKIPMTLLQQTTRALTVHVQP